MSKRKEYGLDIPPGATIRNNRMSWYTVYDTEDNLVVQGPARMCAEFMGLTMESFRCYATRSKRGPYFGIRVYVDVIDPAEVYETVV